MLEVKLTEKKVNTKNVVRFDKMAIGQIGIPSSGYAMNKDAIILRTHHGFVNLRKPNETWPVNDECCRPSEFLEILKNPVITIEHEV